jgi:hypothetical protein
MKLKNLFVNKNILEMRNDIQDVWMHIFRMEQKLGVLEKRPLCTDNNHLLDLTVEHVKAIEKYLDIVVEERLERDPRYIPEQPRMMTVMVARKRKERVESII